MCRVAASLVLWHSSPEMVTTLCRSLAASQVAPIDVWIHVNDDPDGGIGATTSHLLSGMIPARISSSGKNLGYAEAHNRLIDQAFASTSADFVLVVNPDLRLESDAIAEMVHFYQSQRDVTLVGPVLELANGSQIQGTGLLDSAGIRWNRWGRHFDTFQGRPLGCAPVAPSRVSAVSGACLLVSRDAFHRIVASTGEFFDEDFFAYREDAELGLRASLVGIESWIVPTAHAWHIRTLRGTERGKNVEVDRLGVRNRFLLAFKYGSGRPGGWLGAPLRDLVVLAGVLVRERSSWAGVADAWRLRRKMRRKRSLIERARTTR